MVMRFKQQKCLDLRNKNGDSTWFNWSYSWFVMLMLRSELCITHTRVMPPILGQGGKFHFDGDVSQHIYGNWWIWPKEYIVDS
jgi:hypothetical protein